MKGIINEIREAQKRAVHPDYVLRLGRLSSKWKVWYTESAGRYKERTVYRKTNPFLMHGSLGLSWLILYEILQRFAEYSADGGPVWEVTHAISTADLLSYMPYAALALVGLSIIGGVWGYTQTREEVSFDRETMYPPEDYWEGEDP